MKKLRAGQTTLVTAVCAAGTLLGAATHTGCLAEMPAYEDAESDDKALPYAEGSAEAIAIVAAVNDPTVTAAILRSDAGLATRPATNIIKKRNGADGVVGTADDDAFDTLLEVDKVPYVGPVVLGALLDFAAERGYYQPGGAAEVSVIFSPQPAATSHTARAAEWIDMATTSVDVAMYSFSDAGVSAALERAVARGVDVRFIFETAGEDKSLTGTAKENSKSGKLEKLGVNVRYVNKIMHHKFVIVDGPRDSLASAKTAGVISGSGNFSYGGAQVYDENTLFVRGNPEAAASFQREFNLMWEHSREFSLAIDLPYDLSSLDLTDLEGIADDPNFAMLVTSDNMTWRASSPTTFSSNWQSTIVADAWAAAIAGATQSIYIASGHLRLLPIAEALIAAKQARPSLDIKVYVDQQEYLSVSGEAEQDADLEACLAAANTDKKIFACENKDRLFAKSLGDAGISVMYKVYAYRFNAAYAVQMHNKFMIIDGDELFTGSYNLSINAEHDTFENSLHLKGSPYALLIASYKQHFLKIWKTGEGKLPTLRARISNDATIPLVFDPIAMTWKDVRDLRALISANCPLADSAEYRQNPTAHKTCPRQ